MRFCTYCGFALSGAPGYCGGCGASVDQAAGSGPPPAATSPTSDPPVPPPGQGPPDPWGRQDAPEPWPHPDAPDPWPHPDASDTWPGQDTPSDTWPGQDTPSDTWPGQGPPGLATEQPAGSPVGPDPFGHLFATDSPPPVAQPEFRSAVGLVNDDVPRAARTADRPAHTRRRGVMIFATVAMVAVLAASGVGAWWVTSHRAPVRSAAAPSPSRPSQSRPSQSRSSSASPSATALPTAASDAVAIAPAVAGQPDAPGVAAFLKAYFRSINSHDFAAYTSLFVPQLRESAQHFNAGYQSTTDSGATLTGLTATGSGSLAATVTFLSRQNPADSPNNAGCDEWNVVLPLDRAGTGYLITLSPAGYQPAVHACP
jgi:hypothetical protein